MAFTGPFPASASSQPSPSSTSPPPRDGKAGEAALAKWFNANGLAHVSICQQPETFATLFAGTVKRPDFLLLFDSLGLIAVDAKNLSVYKPQQVEYYSLPLDEEVRRAIAFERIFRMPIWYAVMGDDDEWYWISGLKAVEVGYPNQSSEGKSFINIRRSDFVVVRTGDDLAKLYGQRMPSYNKQFLP